MDEKELKLLLEGYLQYLTEDQAPSLDCAGCVVDIDGRRPSAPSRLEDWPADTVEDDSAELPILDDMMSTLRSLGPEQLKILENLLQMDIEQLSGMQNNIIEDDTGDRKVFILIREYLKHKRVISCPNCNTLLAVTGYGEYGCKCGEKFKISRIV